MQENRSHDAQADGRPQQIGALELCVIEGVGKIVEGADAADSEEGDGGPLDTAGLGEHVPDLGADPIEAEIGAGTYAQHDHFLADRSWNRFAVSS